MSPGFDRAADFHQSERLDPPSGRSTWVAIGIIVVVLITILAVLSIVGDFGTGAPSSTVAEIPAVK